MSEFVVLSETFVNKQTIYCLIKFGILKLII